MTVTSPEGKSTCFHVSVLMANLIKVSVHILPRWALCIVGYIVIQSLDAIVLLKKLMEGSCNVTILTVHHILPVCCCWEACADKWMICWHFVAKLPSVPSVPSPGGGVCPSVRLLGVYSTKAVFWWSERELWSAWLESLPSSLSWPSGTRLGCDLARKFSTASSSGCCCCCGCGRGLHLLYLYGYLGEVTLLVYNVYN